MSHIMQSSEPALELLGQALPPLPESRTSLVDGFELKMAHLLLQQAYRDNPTITALPDGRSILAATIKINPELALAWWRLRGEDAWRPTRSDPTPASVVFGHVVNSYDSERRAYTNFCWLDACKDKQEQASFMTDAIKQGVVLKVSDVDKWEAKITLNAKFKNQLTAHKEFLSAILTCSKNTQVLSQEQVLKILLANNAVLFDSVKLEVDEIAEGRSFPPAQPFLKMSKAMERASSKEALSDPESLWRAWHEMWWSSYDRRFKTDVMEWLNKEGLATPQMRATVLEEELTKIADRARETRGPANIAWDRIVSAINQVGGWEMESEGALVWQSTIATHQALIPCAIANPPPQGLGDRSSKGQGLWDIVRSLGEDTSKTNLLKLHAALPLHENPPKRALFSRLWPWERNEEAFHALFDRVVRKSSDPTPWIGTDPLEQLEVAATLLRGLCSPDPEIVRAAQLITNNLLGPHLDLPQSSTFTTIALPIIQQVAQATPRAANLIPNAALNLAATSGDIRCYPKAVNQLLTLINKKRKNHNETIESAPFNVLTSVMEQIKLETQTPVVPPSTKAQRGRRI